ncbi:type II toxin-antitoxin system PemK/MazF family toxin [Demequina sp. SYSU T00039]|uniref:Type II toxin-antitoxin system PemK/MazF family toxin n=1 Tax=Demequina lignilytica TaxID=3051663 RepID=A0AAW7M561_9MICO|nr:MULTISPECIES: type II toxin-antitoxin system PemK/MazF family toxin [unclassified Demequina]MDN4478457.1 type II toxin-antitoxin system PemK/MazF family toxin [Demequina sp. SYSU T00039-1]MDN4487036.1 type II toxin-antitoxin system PemK/MazF family toxin [Demequina sp. SYSU T00039]MDN4489747.1 type II toxin-antitoxin system PemK/MazF family toxin [Demequina sp. SYSU T00068]
MSRTSWTDLLRRIVAAIRTTPAPGRRAGAQTPAARAARTAAYPGDFTGRPRVAYRPQLDGDPDPGEVVWTWVPFEEDHAQGKDRPVLLIGHDGPWLLALMLSSKDHDADARDEARWGRYWMDIGSGPWDSRGRPSEVRLDRIIRVDPGAVRREGAVLDRATFDRVADSLKRHHP